MKKPTLYQATIEKSINCPQCGDTLPLYFKWSKLVQCPSCKSSIFLEDKSVILLGDSSALSPEPSLINIQEPFIFEKKSYLPLGKIRYSYGRGFWEEWFLKGEANQEFWLSIDEGDFALEQEAKITMPFHNIHKLTLGKSYGTYVVTEIGEGECVGFTGELPENISVGKLHQYAHLSEGGSSLITVESSSSKRMKVFKGNWIDPFKITKVYG
ncbi:MAG TPA: DUF4178 domain-containing protein [Campylobacterales bacterium]|nr:DUF4178 domain-containing protein [Campylobacterales bacterium]